MFAPPHSQHTSSRTTITKRHSPHPSISTTTFHRHQRPLQGIYTIMCITCLHMNSSLWAHWTARGQPNMKYPDFVCMNAQYRLKSTHHTYESLTHKKTITLVSFAPRTGYNTSISSGLVHFPRNSNFFLIYILYLHSIKLYYSNLQANVTVAQNLYRGFRSL